MRISSLLSFLLLLFPFSLIAQEITPISEIQGRDLQSSIVGEAVTVEGVVTGIYLSTVDDPGLHGFFLVEEPEDRDGDPETSEGLFIYAPDADSSLRPGDVVQVRGRVREYETGGGTSSLTELSGVSSVDRIGTAPIPDPVPIFLPADFDRLEMFEGMNVRLMRPMVVVENYNLDRFGEVSLALRDQEAPADAQRPVWPTMYLPPGDAAAEALEDARQGRIVLDDGSTSTWPVRGPGGTPWTEATLLFCGSVLQQPSGILDDRFGAWRLQPDAGGFGFTDDGREPHPPTFSSEGDTAVLRVASFNVGNYFVTLRNSESGCGPGQNLDCRGAETFEERERQEAKLATTIGRLDADIVALVEIENTPGVDPAGRLAEIVGAETTVDYSPIQTGLVGSDAIRCGYIYRTESVEPVGSPLVLDQTVDSRFNHNYNRPSIAQRFRLLRTGATVTVVVSHLKSKGSPCDEVGDPDQQDGQGNCSETRRLAAEALAEWVEEELSDSGREHVMLVGDFNAYAEEDAMTSLADAGFARVTIETPDDSVWNDYTYSYDGLVGSLDHALVTPSLIPHVSGAAAWHINADAPDLLDYRTGRKSVAQIALIDGSPYRSSDHDPVVIEVRPDPDSITTDVPEIESGEYMLDLTENYLPLSSPPSRRTISTCIRRWRSYSSSPPLTPPATTR